MPVIAGTVLLYAYGGSDGRTVVMLAAVAVRAVGDGWGWCYLSEVLVVLAVPPSGQRGRLPWHDRAGFHLGADTSAPKLLASGPGPCAGTTRGCGRESVVRYGPYAEFAAGGAGVRSPASGRRGT